LPALETYRFMFRNGKAQNFLLGQCPGCRVIYWEEA
jgi:hypothetical protein